MRVSPGRVIGLLSLMCVACASGSAVDRRASGAMPIMRLSERRSPPSAQSSECDSIVARSRSHPAIVQLKPPAESDRLTLVTMPNPPMPIPRTVRGKEVEVKFLVDPDGYPASVLVLEVSDARYGEELADKLVAGARFQPLREGDCRVYALATLTLRF